MFYIAILTYINEGSIVMMCMHMCRSRLGSCLGTFAAKAVQAAVK